jgi:preprotein translocase subunit YajC
LSTFLFQPSTAPGREGPSSPPPQQTQPAQGPPTEGAPPRQPGGSGDGYMMIMLLVVPLMLFFFMSRSQQKKQKQLESSLKVGDRVVTRSGIIGKIIESGERKMKLEIAPGVNVMVLKTMIDGLDVDEAKLAEAKKDAAAKDGPKDGKEPAKDKPQEKKA